VPIVVLVTAREASQILGIGVPSVYALASAGHLVRHAPRHSKNARAYDLDQLEQRSLSLLGYHDSAHPHWTNVGEVADYLGVHRSRVRQLLDADRIPFVAAPNGRRYVRRSQLEVIANARDLRVGRVRATPEVHAVGD